MGRKKTENGGENEAAFEWTKPKYEAVQLLAEDELTDEEIASKIGVGESTLTRWKRVPEFKAKIRERAEELGGVARRYAITRKARRIRNLNDRVDRMHQIIRDRAADPKMLEVPGGATGMLVRDVKAVNGEMVELYRFDAALLKALLDHERQAAQEAGQWAEKHEHTGKDGEAIAITFIEIGSSSASPAADRVDRPS